MSYGILGITDIDDEKISEICNDFGKATENNCRSLNLITYSCQEFALETANKILWEKDNIFLQDPSVFAPLNIVSETKTIRNCGSTTVLLLVSITFPTQDKC